MLFFLVSLVNNNNNKSTKVIIMGEKGRFDGEIQLPGGSFSRLLLSSDDVEDKTLCLHSPLFSCNTPKMLCFGDFNSKITPKLTLSTVNDKITVSNSNVSFSFSF